MYQVSSTVIICVERANEPLLTEEELVTPVHRNDMERKMDKHSRFQTPFRVLNDHISKRGLLKIEAIRLIASWVQCKL